MNHSELLDTRANTPAPKPPSLTSKKINEAEEVRKQVEAFIAKGGNYEIIESDRELISMTAKEQMQANYLKDVENGKNMDPPVKPKKTKKKNFGLIKP